MTRGVILFAFNSPKYNYYEMASYTAKRIHHFLKLPVTLITDIDSLPEKIEAIWDNIITVSPDKNNFRDWGIWINKGRYRAYELSPYDETLVLDVDYVINSDKLLKIFDFHDDFCCHNKTKFVMEPCAPQELLSTYSYETLWATVIMFRKSGRAKQIFECLEMVEKNFEHYSNIHHFISKVYRNDYGLTLALRIANGHSQRNNDFIVWDLLHVGKNTHISKNTNDLFNTEYTAKIQVNKRGKTKTEYIIIRDMDFHIMDKDLFVEMING
jgi:hypothetical protein